MESIDIITLLTALIGVLGGGAAWQYYQKRLEVKSQSQDKQHDRELAYRGDLQERVAVLETKLEESRAQRDDLMDKLRLLSEETAALRVEVKYLREERQSLQTTIDRLTEQLAKELEKADDS